MDGQYVPNISFGPLVVEAVRKQTDVELESHLMISTPDDYLAEFIKAGSNTVLVHPSTCPSVMDTLKKIHDLGAKAGLVVNPDENLSLVLPYLNEMDQVLIMSVFPGFGGQKFISKVLKDLPDLLQAFRENDILVEIDGGVNNQTLPGLIGHGINRFVAGSAVFNSEASPGQNYLSLMNQLNQV
jgi:ribulose-phosphate 3-epimerase